MKLIKWLFVANIPALLLLTFWEWLDPVDARYDDATRQEREL